MQREHEVEKRQLQLKGIELYRQILLDMADQGLERTFEEGKELLEKYAHDFSFYFLPRVQDELLNFCETEHIPAERWMWLIKQYDYCLKAKNYAEDENLGMIMLDNKIGPKQLRKLCRKMKERRILVLNKETINDYQMGDKEGNLHKTLCLDLISGEIHLNRLFVPDLLSAIYSKNCVEEGQIVKPQGLLAFSGWLNRDIIWKRGNEKVFYPTNTERAKIINELSLESLARALELFREQLTDLQAPRHAYFLIKNSRIKNLEGKKVLEDEKGQRVILANSSKNRKGQLLSERKLCEALCCERKNGSFLLKLFWDWRSGRVFAEPLTIYSEGGYCKLKIKRGEAFEEDGLWTETLSKNV